jgi:hypothetical protein
MIIAAALLGWLAVSAIAAGAFCVIARSGRTEDRYRTYRSSHEPAAPGPASTWQPVPPREAPSVEGKPSATSSRGRTTR